MESYSETILVPYDFTEKADCAVRHASRMAKGMKAGIVLLHIVKKESESDEQSVLLKNKADEFSQEEQVPVGFLVKEGTIFKTINEVVDDTKAIAVVMGTHGIKGIQKFTGSWALKVIVGCHVPYLIVQRDPEYQNPLNILFPVDHKLETKEKLKWASLLTSLGNIKVVLFAQQGNGPLYDNPTRANMVFCKKYLEDRNIAYEAEWADKKGSFYEASLKFAKEHKVDMIMITTTRDIAFHDYVLGAYEQVVIANEAQIPVFVVNPRTDVKMVYSNF